MIIETLAGGILALLGWMIKENTKAINKISGSLEKLANNVAYCPLNNKIKKSIKEPISEN